MNNLQSAERTFNRSLSEGGGGIVPESQDVKTDDWQQNVSFHHNGQRENRQVAPWVTTSKQSPTSHGMIRQRQPAPILVKSTVNSGFQADTMQMASRPLQMQASRRSRHFVPSCRKDEYYWMKRRKNNEAARKSREKRRNNDMILAQNVLVLLQENLRLRKDLFAVKMKYNEIEPKEFDEFMKRMEDGDLLSGLTQNLNLADYGIPDNVIKALNSGVELSLSNLTSLTQERRSSTGMEHHDIGNPNHNETPQQNHFHTAPNNSVELGVQNGFSLQHADNGTKVESTSVNKDVQENHVNSRQPTIIVTQQTSTSDNEKITWIHTREDAARMETEDVPMKMRSLSEDTATSSHTKSWLSSTSPFVCEEARVTVPSTVAEKKSTEMLYSRDLVDGSEMLQSFIQYTWQQAANHAKKQVNATDLKQLLQQQRSNSDWYKIQEGANSSGSSSDDVPPRVRVKPLARNNSSNSLKENSCTVPPNWQNAMERRESSSSPGSDDNSVLWRNGVGFTTSSSSGDYSSSDSSSSNSHVASPRSVTKREDSIEACDSDDKSCRLPYKLRFKLATLHGGQEEQTVRP